MSPGILETYHALADRSRLRLVAALSHGLLNVQELTSILELSQPTISHHLKILQKADIVLSQRDGTWIFYRLNDESHTATSQITAQFIELSENMLSEDDDLKAIIKSDQKKLATVVSRRRDRTRDYFETVAKGWSKLRNEALGDTSFIDSIIELIPENGTVCELGCGSGVLLDRITPRKGETIGVDYSQAMLDEARELLGKRSTQVELRLGYLEHLPLGDCLVDLAVSYMVMHHLAEPQIALIDACRIIKPGGRLLITDLTPHKNEKLREQYSHVWLGFEPKQFKSWVEKTGFTEVETTLLGENNEAFLLKAVKK